MALRGVRGRERREHFNRLALSAAASAGMASSVVLGPVGSLVGPAGGLWLGGLAIQ